VSRFLSSCWAERCGHQPIPCPHILLCLLGLDLQTRSSGLTWVATVTAPRDALTLPPVVRPKRRDPLPNFARSDFSTLPRGEATLPLRTVTAELSEIERVLPPGIPVSDVDA